MKKYLLIIALFIVSFSTIKAEEVKLSKQDSLDLKTVWEIRDNKSTYMDSTKVKIYQIIKNKDAKYDSTFIFIDMWDSWIDTTNLYNHTFSIKKGNIFLDRHTRLITDIRTNKVIIDLDSGQRYELIGVENIMNFMLLDSNIRKNVINTVINNNNSTVKDDYVYIEEYDVWVSLKDKKSLMKNDRFLNFLNDNKVALGSIRSQEPYILTLKKYMSIIQNTTIEK